MVRCGGKLYAGTTHRVLCARINRRTYATRVNAGTRASWAAAAAARRRRLDGPRAVSRSSAVFERPLPHPKRKKNSSVCTSRSATAEEMAAVRILCCRNRVQAVTNTVRHAAIMLRIYLYIILYYYCLCEFGV